MLVSNLVARLEGDHSDFDRKMGEAESRLDRFTRRSTTARVGLDTSGVERGAASIQSHFSGIQAAAQRTQSIVSRVLISLLAYRAIDATFRIAGDAVLGFNSKLEQAQIGFTTMLGSAEKATGFLRDLQRFAQQTPFQFQDLLEASRRMLALGFASEQVLPLLTSIGNAVAALGTGNVGIERITLALGQMAAKTTVQAEEMRQLTEAGIPAWQILAKVLGTDVATAMEKVRDRTVQATTFIQGFQRDAASRFGDMMLAQSRTFMGAMNNIHDSIQVVGGTALRPFYDLVTRLAVRLADFLMTDQAQRWAEGFAEGLQDVIDRFRFLVRTVGALFGGATEGRQFTLLRRLGLDVNAARSVTEFIRNLGYLTSAIRQIGGAFGDLFGGRTDFASFVDRIGAAFGGVGSASKGILARLDQIKNDALAKLVEVRDAIVGWITDPQRITDLQTAWAAWGVPAIGWLDQRRVDLMTQLDAWKDTALAWITSPDRLGELQTAWQTWGEPAIGWLGDNVVQPMLDRLGAFRDTAVGWITSSDRLTDLTGAWQTWGEPAVGWLADRWNQDMLPRLDEWAGNLTGWITSPDRLTDLLNAWQKWGDPAVAWLEDRWDRDLKPKLEGWADRLVGWITSPDRIGDLTAAWQRWGIPAISWLNDRWQRDLLPKLEEWNGNVIAWVTSSDRLDNLHTAWVTWGVPAVAWLGERKQEMLDAIGVYAQNAADWIGDESNQTKLVAAFRRWGDIAANWADLTPNQIAASERNWEMLVDRFFDWLDAALPRAQQRFAQWIYHMMAGEEVRREMAQSGEGAGMSLGEAIVRGVVKALARLSESILKFLVPVYPELQQGLSNLQQLIQEAQQGGVQYNPISGLQVGGQSVGAGVIGGIPGAGAAAPGAAPLYGPAMPPSFGLSPTPYGPAMPPGFGVTPGATPSSAFNPAAYDPRFAELATGIAGYQSVVPFNPRQATEAQWRQLIGYYASQYAPTGVDPATFAYALMTAINVENRGQPHFGAVGPPTPYGQAFGIGQALPNWYAAIPAAQTATGQAYTAGTYQQATPADQIQAAALALASKFAALGPGTNPFAAIGAYYGNAAAPYYYTPPGGKSYLVPATNQYQQLAVQYWQNPQAGYLPLPQHVAGYQPPTLPLPGVAQGQAITDNLEEPAVPATNNRVQAAQQIIAKAAQYLGVAYRLGGTDFSAIDCSSLVQQAYAAAGLQLPRTTFEQIGQSQIIPQSEARPGDLIFFQNTYDPGAAIKQAFPKTAQYTHVGIYAGEENGVPMMLNARYPSARREPVSNLAQYNPVYARPNVVAGLGDYSYRVVPAMSENTTALHVLTDALLRAIGQPGLYNMTPPPPEPSGPPLPIGREPLHGLGPSFVYPPVGQAGPTGPWPWPQIPYEAQTPAPWMLPDAADVQRLYGGRYYGFDRPSPEESVSASPEWMDLQRSAERSVLSALRETVKPILQDAGVAAGKAMGETFVESAGEQLAEHPLFDPKQFAPLAVLDALRKAGVPERYLNQALGIGRVPVIDSPLGPQNAFYSAAAGGYVNLGDTGMRVLSGYPGATYGVVDPKTGQLAHEVMGSPTVPSIGFTGGLGSPVVGPGTGGNIGGAQPGQIGPITVDQQTVNVTVTMDGRTIARETDARQSIDMSRTYAS